MTNDEGRMTKEVRSPNDEGLSFHTRRYSGFVIGHSFVLRHSGFVIPIIRVIRGSKAYHRFVLVVRGSSA
jgi:hypothetical protein